MVLVRRRLIQKASSQATAVTPSTASAAALASVSAGSSKKSMIARTPIRLWYLTKSRTTSALAPRTRLTLAIEAHPWRRTPSAAAVAVHLQLAMDCAHSGGRMRCVASRLLHELASLIRADW
eukprot:scaffold274467_cov34-Tisochrysis_lutea.AAC.3